MHQDIILPNVELQGVGRYKFIRRHAESGIITQETPWSKNLITNIGINDLGTQVPVQYCWVGSGNATPLVTDERLQAPVATTTTQSPDTPPVYTQSTAAPWWGGFTHAWRFGQGVAAGNLSEVGVGRGSGITTGYQLWSRALIRDANGNPTTITVLPNEFLDVVYDFRFYLPADDYIFPGIEIFGNLHKFTARGRAQAAASSQGGTPRTGFSEYTFTLLRDAALAPITASNMTGVNLGNFTASRQAYVNNSLKRVWSGTAGLTVANHANGISGIEINSSAGNYQMPRWQVLIEPPILKTNADTLTLSFEYGWGRRP